MADYKKIAWSVSNVGALVDILNKFPHDYSIEVMVEEEGWCPIDIYQDEDFRTLQITGHNFWDE